MNADAWWTLLEGDVLARLADLADESVHSVVTSPPYWGLRDYGTAVWLGGIPDHEHVGQVPRTMPAGSAKQASNAGSVAVSSGDCACGAVRQDRQLGLEPTVDEYVDRLVAIFREVRRVLRRDGTVWLNLGDSYASGGLGRRDAESLGEHDLIRGHAVGALKGRTARRVAKVGAYRPRELADGLKPKDLVGIPWKVAFALQADGWWLRADIIWAKPNPMPESVTDRPTKAHEFVFLLARADRYYFDQEAVREPLLWPNGPNAPDAISSPYGQGFTRRADARRLPYRSGNLARKLGAGGRVKESLGSSVPWEDDGGGRNIRSVWTIATEPFPEAHFATFPKRLVEPCVKAGTSEGGACSECGTPLVRILEVERRLEPGRQDLGLGPKTFDYPSHPAVDGVTTLHHERTARTTGWARPCGHDAAVTPCVVLDPFAGSGTTGVVALRLGRSFVGIDLSAEYVALARRRIEGDAPLFNVGRERGEIGG